MLAQAGAQLVLNGFGDSSHARAEVAALGKIPGYHDADLRDVGQIEAMMRYAESTFGGVDIVINAGIQHVAPVEQFRWTNGTIFSPSISSVFHTTRRRCRVCASATGAHHQHCLSAWHGGVERNRPTSPPSTRWSADQTVASKPRAAASPATPSAPAGC